MITPKRRRVARKWTLPGIAVLMMLVVSLGFVACDNNGDGDTPGSLADLVDDVQVSVVTVAHPQGEGSGVVWDDDGHIVTNNHVVGGATDVMVVLSDGERLPATIVATDALTDLAVLRVEHDGLKAASFNVELPRVGDAAVAIGNPLGFEGSVTSGIISGLHRAIPSGGMTPALVDLVQTDAAISPGNSGGALVNHDGEVVGINVAYIPPQQRAVALGFAIPASTVVDVVEALLDDGVVDHAFLGIEPRPVTPAVAAELGLGVDWGVFVAGVQPGSAAESAGIEEGDVIVGMAGEEVTTVERLWATLREVSPGETIEVTVLRGTEEATFEVQLQARPTGN